MIILKIKIVDFVVVDIKGEPPVARHRNAPRSAAVAGKLVDAPARRAFEFPDALDALQSGEDAPEPVHKIAPDPSVVVIFDKALQPPCVGQFESSCAPNVRRYRTAVNVSQIDRKPPAADFRDQVEFVVDRRRHLLVDLIAKP